MPASNNEKKNKRSIQILIDDRERNERLIQTLRASDTEVRFGQLTTGDYMMQNLLIERKTIADFCVSIEDGRLFRQAVRLASADRQPLIILEGTSTDLIKSGLKREAVQGALITLNLIFKIPVLRSMSPEETARLILYSARQIENRNVGYNIYPRSFRGRKVINRKQKIQIHVLQGFPGIGPIRSKQLLKKFGSLLAFFNASEEELNDIPGISKGLVKQIHTLIK